MAKIIKNMLLVGSMVCFGAVMHPAAGDAQASIEGLNRSPEELQPEVEMFVRKNGGDVQEAFFCAVRSHKMREMRYVEPLIAMGARIDDVDLRGNTALHIVAYGGCEEVVMKLIEAGARIDSVGEYGRTALHLATLRGNSKIMRILIKARAGVDAVDENRRTALHWAVRKAYKEIVKILIEAGARIDAICRFGRTVLEVGILSAEDDRMGILYAEGMGALYASFECFAIARMLIEGYRMQLERQYPIRERVLLNDEEFEKLARLSPLTQDGVECVIDCLPNKDLGRMACVSKVCNKLAYNILRQRFPDIKKDNFDAYINRAWRCARKNNIQIMVPLLDQSLLESVAVAVQRESNGAGAVASAVHIGE